MRRSSISVVALVVAFSIIGCKLTKKTDTIDEEESIADAATVTVSGTGAKNEKGISRYAKEDKIADEPAVIAKDVVKVKSFPGGGHDVATLSRRTPVAKIAKYFSTGVLVTFDDPSGDGKLLGWVLPEQLAAPGAAQATTVTVVKPIGKPADAGAAAPRDAGLAAPDAGGARVADAGGPPAVDAGAPKISSATLFVPLQPDGKCPQGFAPSPPGCRRPCNADTDCPRTTICAPRDGKKSCQLK